MTGKMKTRGQIMDTKAGFATLLATIVAAAAMRLVPHPPNFTPIAAMALVSGAYLPRRALSFAAPFGALLVSDAILGFYPGIGVVYAAFALTILIGWVLASKRSPLRIGIATVASSVLFFVVTNFGMWLSSGIYPHTGQGIVDCYVAAIPFFRNSLAGDILYSAMLFGILSLAVQVRERPAVQG